MSILLDERGKACPLPVVEAKKALETAQPGTALEVLVDNETAVQNLRKLSDQLGLVCSDERRAEGFVVTILAAEEAAACALAAGEMPESGEGQVVALGSDVMGQGDDTLGRLLMQGFVFALTQQDHLPRTVLLYNGGAHLSCAGSECLADLQKLEKQGVQILTCGTCLNHYGLTEKLSVGSVTNMYEIVRILTTAARVIRP